MSILSFPRLRESIFDSPGLVIPATAGIHLRFTRSCHSRDCGNPSSIHPVLSFTRLRESIFDSPGLVIHATAGIHLRLVFQISPSYKSFHSGFILLIISIFQALRHFFNCFSRTIASYIL